MFIEVINEVRSNGYTIQAGFFLQPVESPPAGNEIRIRIECRFKVQLALLFRPESCRLVELDPLLAVV